MREREMKNGNHGRHMAMGFIEYMVVRNLTLIYKKRKQEVVIPLHWPTLCRPPLCWLFLSIDYVKTRTSGTGGKNWMFCFPFSFPNTGDCIAPLLSGSLVLLASKKFWPTPNTFTKKAWGFAPLTIMKKKKPLKEKLCWVRQTCVGIYWLLT